MLLICEGDTDAAVPKVKRGVDAPERALEFWTVAVE